MDTNTFWALLDRTKKLSSDDPHKQAELLVKELIEMSVQDIMDYDKIYKKLADKAYTADLWAAAAIIYPWGCSEDGFMDFRAWLIAQGQAAYERVLEYPEALADIVDVGIETQVEKLSFVSFEAYKSKTGQEEMPSNANYVVPELKGKLPPDRAQSKARHPRLAAKFG
jgi:hypothetical protein